MISRFVVNTQRTSLIIGKCKCNVWVGGLELEWFVFEGLTYIFCRVICHDTCFCLRLDSWNLWVQGVPNPHLLLELHILGRILKDTELLLILFHLNYQWFVLVYEFACGQAKKEKESIKIACWRQNQRNAQSHAIYSLKSLTSFSRIALSTKVIYVSFY